MAKIAIIGGGIAGCATALELSKQKHDILILEASHEILKGTSARTPGRMGLGYHYFDFETAKLYMEQTVNFMKKYSDCFLGSGHEDSYLQNGRYFIVKDSLISTQDLMSTYDDISQEFEKMKNDDPTNDIFKTAHLHRTLKQKEYQGDVDAEKVAFAIETRECLLDWQKFEERLKKELSEVQNISVIENFLVSNVEVNPDGKFQLSKKNSSQDSQEVSFEFDYVVNCTWQNIEFLNEKLGIGDSHFRKNNSKEAITSRLKLLAEVRLPDSLKEKHSMFFCVGPHAMFSNVGNGIGRITYAPVTNFGTTTESKMPVDFQRWLTEGLSEEEEKKYGQKIINGVAQYIPAMIDAQLVKVIPGIVKSKGEVNLTDKDSDFHKRNYSGVQEQQIGWVDNAAMKLFYCLGNAKEVAEIISRQMIANDNISSAAKILARSESERIFPNDESQRKIPERILQSFFVNYIQRNFATAPLLVRKKRKSPELTYAGEKSEEMLKSPSKVSSSGLEVLEKLEIQVAKKNNVSEELKIIAELNSNNSVDNKVLTPSEVVERVKARKIIQDQEGIKTPERFGK